MPRLRPASCGAAAVTRLLTAPRVRRSVTLKQLLDEFKDKPGLNVHWMTFGSNGRETRPPRGGALRAYTSCSGVVQKTGKIIANMYFMIGPASNPHTMRFVCDLRSASTRLAGSAYTRSPAGATQSL